jgi:hypothetical protein
VQSTRIPGARPGGQPNPVAEFVDGVGQGLMMLGKEPWRESMLR